MDIILRDRLTAFNFFTRLLLFCVAMTVTLDSFAGGKRKFGVFGSHGETGSHGRDGQPGPFVEIMADGPQKSFVLNGSDGGHGTYGGDGSHAYDCEQPHKPDRNLRAASGGDGGDGGRGGHGGDGGNATIFYTHLKELKQLKIVSRGGQGGQGGQGGRGGKACGCYRPEWNVRVCENKKQPDGSSSEVCKNNHHFCVDGDHGQHGSSGARGQRGESGSLYLVQGKSELEPDRLKNSYDLPEIANRRITLSENKFKTKRDAKELLAQGSRVSDRYFVYDYTEKPSVEFEWLVNRPISDFSTAKIELWKNEEQIDYAIKSALVQFSETGEKNKSVQIRNLVLREEARAAIFSVEPNGPESQIVISDQSAFARHLRDSISLKFYTKTLFGWKKRLDRELEPSEWQRKNSDIHIALKELGLKKKFVKKKRRVKLVVALNRQLGDDKELVEFEEKLRL